MAFLFFCKVGLLKVKVVNENENIWVFFWKFEKKAKLKESDFEK